MHVTNYGLTIRATFDNSLLQELRHALGNYSREELEGRCDFLVTVLGVPGWRVFVQQLDREEKAAVQGYIAMDVLTENIRIVQDSLIAAAFRSNTKFSWAHVAVLDR